MVSPYHLVGSVQDGFGHCQAEGLRGLQVDNELNLRGTLYRKLGWLGAAENLGDKKGTPLGRRRYIGPIGDSTAGFGKQTRHRGRRQPVLERQLGQLVTLHVN